MGWLLSCLKCCVFISDTNRCSVNNGGCEHFCDEASGKLQCRCKSGYELLSDGKSCRGEKKIMY